MSGPYPPETSLDSLIQLETSHEAMKRDWSGELDDAEAVAECSRVIAHHSKSFSFASRFFSRETRREVAVLYAWCRRADDAVDEVPPDEARRALELLYIELDAVYAEGETDLVQRDVTLRAFRALVRKRNIPKYYPLQLLKGMQMDLEDARYLKLESLYLYCYRVASTVGLMMCHLMGVRREEALINAAHLGVAMQLTNISRDVSEDWSRGRLYLPLDLLKSVSSEHEKRFLEELESDESWRSISSSDGVRFERALLPPLMRSSAQGGIRELLRIADRHYHWGERGISALPARASLAIQAAGMIYQDIGRVIRAHHCDPHQGRAFTSKRRKTALALRAVTQHFKRVMMNRFSPEERLLYRATLKTPQEVFTFERLLTHINDHSKALQSLEGPSLRAPVIKAEGSVR